MRHPRALMPVLAPRLAPGLARAAAARRLFVVGLSVVCLSVLAAPADARGNDEVVRRGSCSGATHWKLKAKSEDGRIELEAEVDSNHDGQTWNWKMLHNGDVTAHGSRTTRAPSGSFEVKRVVVNLAGADHLKLRARNPRSGEVCRGSVTF